MEFQQTGLPDTPLFRHAFKIGWRCFRARFASNDNGMTVADMDAAALYRRGPVAVARLIMAHGGEDRRLAAAASLAGPAVFSAKPCAEASDGVKDFAKELRAIEHESTDRLIELMPALSLDVRLFLQASAIRYLDTLAFQAFDVPHRPSVTEEFASFSDAVRLFGAARGETDDFGLDTRFEVAVLKARMSPGIDGAVHRRAGAY